MRTLIRYRYISSIVFLVFIFSINVFAQTSKENNSTPLFKIKTSSWKEHKSNQLNWQPESVSDGLDSCHVYNGDTVTFQGIGTQVSPDLPIPMFNAHDLQERTHSPSIIIDPIDKNKIFTAAFADMYEDQAWVNGIDQEKSDNYGISSWSGGVNDNVIEGYSLGNPAVAAIKIGNSRRLYCGSVMMYYYYYDDIFKKCAGQGVSYSDDNGSTWTNKLLAIPNFVNGDALYYLNLNHLAVDTNVNSPYYGSVYSAWTPITNEWKNYNQFGVPDYGKIAYKYSRDGETWTDPDYPAQVISDSDSLGIVLNCGVNLQVGLNGEVYAVWAMYHNDTLNSGAAGRPPFGSEFALGFAKSVNGGQSFSSASTIINNIKGINRDASFHYYHDFYPVSFPVMCVDHSPVHPGRIYVAWSNIGVPGINEGLQSDLYIMHSDDSGQTWSTPVKITTLEGETITKSTAYPWITCDNETGAICVVYYDDRNFSKVSNSNTDGAWDSRMNTYVSLSSDGGTNWAESHSLRKNNSFEYGGINCHSFCAVPTVHPLKNIPFFNDFNGISVKDGLAYPVWTSNHAQKDQEFVDVYTVVSPFYVWNCIPYYVLNASNSLQTGQVKKFECQQYVSAYDMSIPNTSFGFFDAGDSITLHEGFHAVDGCYFHAYLDGCTPFTCNDRSYKYFSGSNNSYNAHSNNLYKTFLSDNLIKVYPNPTQGIFTVDLGELEESTGRLLLSNSMGETILDIQPSSQQSIEINLSNYPKGLYVIKLFTGDKNYVNKVIHQ